MPKNIGIFEIMVQMFQKIVKKWTASGQYFYNLVLIHGMRKNNLTKAAQTSQGFPVI